MPTRLFALLSFLFLAFAQTALAQVTAPTIAARAWILLDETTGQVLASHEPDMKVEPASLTKIMTAYLAFDALREKRIALDQRPVVSQAAYKAIGSRMFVEPAKPATVEELLNGVIVQSGNDASIVLAEALAGTEESFAEQMNRAAQRMGLRNTSFRNATGLPDPQHYTTARDLVTLAQRLIEDFPDQYPLYSKRDYTYNNIRQPNRNRLLAIDPSVDGMKTGHTDAAGYCLIASAKRDLPGIGGTRRLISVVLGAASESARAIESQKLLNYGYQNFEVVRIQPKDKPAGTYDVWKGSKDAVDGGFAGDVLVSVPRGQTEQVKAEIERVQPLIAPIAQGQQIGTLRVRIGDQLVAERPLLALSAVEPAGWFGRTWDSLRLMLAR
ncbi:MAG: D-alanyl-D-alanine carboxypeptidase family protein [Burkholderiaceae bacterium]|jgi:D-alanyl-D-alanine carboxypeptidase (penicillin-binding protein 5/6)|nr:D-alanyl-D-alanine carboxypeptidase family protein [Burkholderiaceae bacterium]